MATPRTSDDQRGYVTNFGFRWRPQRAIVDVERMANIQGRGSVLGVTVTPTRGEKKHLQIYVSEAGGSVRVWLGNKELT